MSIPTTAPPPFQFCGRKRGGEPKRGKGIGRRWKTEGPEDRERDERKMRGEGREGGKKI